METSPIHEIEDQNGDLKLPFWLDLFMNYTRNIPSPWIFRLWSGLSCISGALERRVYVRTAGRPIYPNLFILLVSPPGIGKTVAISEIISLWKETGKFNVAPRALPGKGLIDSIADDNAKRRVLDENTGKFITTHSVLVAAPELGTLIPTYDLGFLSNINDIFDCGPEYSERTRGGGLIEIERPHIVLLAGTQPDYLAELLPETAFGMGTTSRMIMVFSADRVELDIFADPPELVSEEYTDMASWLRKLSTLSGCFEFTAGAKREIQAWYSAGLPPEPSHHKLKHYNTRRFAHTMKLTMVMSAARSMTPPLKIEAEDFLRARAVLLQAEATMPDIFRAMSGGGQIQQIEEAYNFILTEYIKAGKKPVPEHKLIAFLTHRAPTYMIGTIIDTMLSARIIREKEDLLAHVPAHLKRNTRSFIPNRMDKGAIQ